MTYTIEKLRVKRNKGEVSEIVTLPCLLAIWEPLVFLG